MNLVRRYTRWLHTQWPAGHVESLPLASDDGTTNVPGVYVVGDLRGIPLLKFSADGGARAVRHILDDGSFRRSSAERPATNDVLDLVIVGAGVSGMSAALEAKKAGLAFEILEANEPFSTIVNFPKGKPIYTYPKEMTPEGDLQVTADVKEALIDELRDQTLGRGIEPVVAHAERVVRRGKEIEVVLSEGDSLLAQRVILALGRSGNFRKLNVPGENLDKVYNRLHDPKDFCGRAALIVGGGDSALETAIALTQCGSDVTLSYRKNEFARPKPENLEMIRKLSADPRADVAVEEPVSERVTTAAGAFLEEHRQPGTLTLKMETNVREITENKATLEHKDGKTEDLPNEVVFAMIGREAPLEFFRRSRIDIAGEWNAKKLLGFLGFFIFCVALYNWKSGGALGNLFYTKGWFPTSLTSTFANAVANPKTVLGTLVISAAGPAFWYTLAYCILVVVFGIRRIHRRKTPYIKVQTVTLMVIQVFPLFLLPEIILPLLHHNGHLWQPLADALFPIVDYGHGREFWRAYGFVLAWPLNVYNVFTHSPIWWWMVISFIQTFVLIPAAIYFWGKGAYCGWICSCGALAETLGDTHRHKMPHGPRWNRLNMAGQVILLIAALILLLRIYGWVFHSEFAENLFALSKDKYKWIVDVFLAGAVGYGVYFWLSGRFWCRFMCPLAALMHIYARFSRFRILADKKKCISCNICTSVCHQGIDIMNFANKGLPMADPECVRCSACVQGCPTGVLTFGQVDREGREISTDRLAASPVQIKER
ncbi:MAG: NAD(P)-binding domain-containing protein [Candidatus Latescibacterota bacterium]|nr:MAG: NAD(P)-binding domain-containing protein [Candidatus Latescibacterota bacterium]